MTPAVTARQRICAALRRERVRPVPVGAVTQTATRYQMETLSTRWPDAHFDAGQMAGLAGGARTLLGFEMVRVPFDQTVEAELCGAEINYGGESANCSVRSRPLSVGDPVPSVPDLTSGRAKVVVEAIALLRRRLGEDAAVIGGTVGPFTLACQLIGTSTVLIEALRRPEGVRPYVDFAVRVGIEYARRQVEAGADAICVEDMGASLDLTSPAIYGSIILPAQRRLCQSIDAPVILHICGANTKILDLLAQAGAAALSLEAKTDLSLAAEGRACAVIGGIPPVDVLLNGDIESVRRSCLESLDAGVHILAPGCGLPLDTPVENLREMSRAASEWKV